MDLLRETILILSGLTFKQENVSETLLSILQRCHKELPDDVTARLEPFYKLNTNIITINECDFTEDLDSIKILSSDEKKSQSNSWILFAEIKNHKVALKLAFEPLVSETKEQAKDVTAQANKSLTEPSSENKSTKVVTSQSNEDNSLEIERLIYRKILNQLIMCGHTPHVVVYFGEILCNNFVDVLNKKLAQNDEIMLKLAHQLRVSEEINPNDNPMPPPFKSDSDELSPLYDINQMRALISEKLIGETFASLLKQYSVHTPKSMQKRVFEQIYLPILAQVFYTLAVFSDFGLVHNDLHANNIYVQKYETSIENCYLIGGKFYKIDSEYQSRIYDFDRGAKSATKYNELQLENTLLKEYCKSFGQCKEVDERREIFTICFFAYRLNTQKNTYLDSFLKKIVPVDLLERKSTGDIPENSAEPENTLAWYGRLCACQEKSCSICSLINDTRIKTVKEIFDLQEMKQYSVEASAVEKSFIWTLPSEAAENFV